MCVCVCVFCQSYIALVFRVSVCFPDDDLCTTSGDTSRVLTGSADNSTRLWDCETGTQLNQFDTGSAVRACVFSYSSNLFVYTTDATMGSVCEIYLYDVRDLEAPVR